VGFVNRDGSLNITVDALPGCKFQLRDLKPREEEPPAKGRTSRRR
jgi:hypothetical protein